MTSPQIGRIARLLQVDPSEVTGLDGVPEADLRVLHDQISKRMFGDAQRQFARVAGLSKSIPAPLVGVLAEKFLPPVMAARVSEMLDPAKARDLIGRVSVDYLVEIALALDPVRSKPVVQQLPPKPIGEVARALFARQEYATMAEFVGIVTTEALLAAFEVATPHDLLAVVPLLEWNDRIDAVVEALPDETLDALLAEIAGGADWEAATATFERLSPAAQQRLLDRFESLSAASRTVLRSAAQRGDLGPAVAALMADGGLSSGDGRVIRTTRSTAG